MARTFVGVGSNVGDRLAFVSKALVALNVTEGIRIVAVSSVYETEPYGRLDQPSFINAVAELEVDMSPADLLRVLKSIEDRLGRTRRERWGPREIDLDILFFGDLVIQERTVSIPHPDLASRRFVLVPLAELAPHYVDPKSGLTVSDLLKGCPDQSQVAKTVHTIEYSQQVA